MMTIFMACLVVLRAQAPAPVPAPPDPVPLERAALCAAAVKSAQTALTEGRRDAALVHCANALALDHQSVAAWRVLFELDKSDADLGAARLWQACTALWSANGVAAIGEPVVRAAISKDVVLLKLQGARIAAAKEIAALVQGLDKKNATSAANMLIVRQLARVAETLCGVASGMCAITAPAFAGFAEHPMLDLKAPLAALKECAEAALLAKDPGTALAMGRLLQAFATQARLQGLRGPKPDGMQPVGMAGANIIGRAREAMRAAQDGGMTTLGALEALDAAARSQFTAAHADPGNPGVTLSPEALYRIETTCGCETLIGAAQTVEMHHRRLATWYGKDPFPGKQGTLRIVPTAAELEAEGTPHWWAGGFQGGDITTLRFAHGTIEGLGRGITHELTHRFDQVIFPGMPSWLVEGRAVWTGGAYAASASESFEERHVSVGTVEAAFIKGYGGRGNLKKLIEGTIEDYRDNYTAGYALMLYLRTAPPEGTPLFATRLEQFMRECATARGAIFDRFVTTFCHPEELGGLPKDFKEFTAGFATWLQGFYWQSRAPFLEHYVTRINAPWDSRLVYDKPTWHKARDHAEPFFGQRHCATLAEMLLLHKKPKDAAVSFAAARLVDEPDAEFALLGAPVLQSQGEAGAAWAMLAEAHVGFPDRVPRTPVPAPLRARLTKSLAYLQELRTAAAAECAARPALAALLHTEAERIAQLLGEAALPAAASTIAAVARVEEQPCSLGVTGYEETELTGYDEHRSAQLWTVLADGLIVGRRQDRGGTGTTDRRAHQVDAFVRGSHSVAAGHWRFSCRVQALTSFISGALVFSDTRRDRHARLRFSCGDFLYAIGRKEEQARVESVSAGFDGLFEREGPLRSAVPDKQVKFATPVADFQLELFVAGNCATAFVNGALVGSYTRPDGAPLEGHVGFASGQGAFRILDPRVTRLDAAAGGASTDTPAWVDPAKSGTIGSPLNRPTQSLLRSQRGSFAIWVPAPTGGTPERPATIRANEVASATDCLARLLKKSSLDLPVSVVLPAGCNAEQRKPILDAIAKLPKGSALIEHRWAKSLCNVPMPDGTAVQVMALCWIDSNGILRAIDPFDGRVDLWSHGVAQWMKGSGLTIIE